MVKITKYSFLVLLVACLVSVPAHALFGFVGRHKDPAHPINFISFTQAQQLITSQLPCKWVSSTPHKTGNKTYDFLCKAGNWGTVTPLLRKSKTVGERGHQGSDLGHVRLIWRAWDPKVHPAGGEAQIAGTFLNFLSHYFVPRKYVDDLNGRFWSPRHKSWRGKYVVVHFKRMEQPGGYALHTLDILGTGEPLPKGTQAPQVQPITPLVSPMPAVPGAVEEITPQTPLPTIAEAPEPIRVAEEEIKAEAPASALVEMGQFENIENMLPVEALEVADPKPVEKPLMDVAVPAQPSAEVLDQAPIPTPVQPEVPVEDAAHYRATLRILTDGVQINGLSAGARVLERVRFPGQAFYQHIPEFEDTSSWREEYEQAESLTKEAVSEDIQNLMDELELGAETLEQVQEDEEARRQQQLEEQYEGFAGDVDRVTMPKTDDNGDNKTLQRDDVDAEQDSLPKGLAIPPARPLQEEEPPQEQQYEDAEQTL